jgi:rRNA-processing protein FCF1
MPRFNFSYEIDRVIPGSRLLIVLEPIFLELEKIRRNSSPKVQMEAKMSIEFVEKVCQRWNSEYVHRNIDFVLLYYGEKRKGIIATNDRKLKKLARKKGIKILFIRNRRFLELQ